MYDVISFGSVVIDLYFKASAFDTDDDHFILSTFTRKDVNEFFQGVGGGAVNVAIGAKHLGCKVGLACVIGENSSTLTVKKFLNAYGIDYHLSEFKENYSNTSLVITKINGERSIINYRSPFTTKYTDPKYLPELTKCKLFYMANLSNMDLKDRTDILKSCKEAGVTTLVNIGIQDCQKGINHMNEFIKQTDIIIVNAYEFATLINKTVDEIDFKKDITEYINLSPDQILVITDGKNGSFGYFDKKVVFQPAKLPPRIVDVNGAGDAYTAGFITSYLNDKDGIKAMIKGADYAAEIISKIGAN